MKGFSHDEKSKAGVGYPSIQGYSHHSFQQPVFQSDMDYSSSPYNYQGYHHNQYIHRQTQNPIIKNGGYYGPLDPQEHEKGFICGRLLIILSVFVILALCFISLIIWMLFGINLPEFEVSSLLVPSFNTTSSTIAAEWKVQVGIANPNEKYRLDFQNMMASIYFKDILLAEAPIGTIHLTPKQHTIVYTVLETKDTGTMLTDDIMAEIELEKKITRSVTFSLGLIGNSTLTSPSSLKSANVRVYCEGLAVDFLDTGFGNMTDSAVDCLLYPSDRK